jgi:hypothetical protein
MWTTSRCAQFVPWISADVGTRTSPPMAKPSRWRSAGSILRGWFEVSLYGMSCRAGRPRHPDRPGQRHPAPSAQPITGRDPYSRTDAIVEFDDSTHARLWQPLAALPDSRSRKRPQLAATARASSRTARAKPQRGFRKCYGPTQSGKAARHRPPLRPQPRPWHWPRWVTSDRGNSSRWISACPKTCPHRSPGIGVTLFAAADGGKRSRH